MKCFMTTQKYNTSLVYATSACYFFCNFLNKTLCGRAFYQKCNFLDMTKVMCQAGFWFI